MNNRGGTNLIAQNVIFIILNVIFLVIIIVFLVSKMSSASVFEEKYAKEVALALDSASPGMIITINMKDALDVARKNLGEANLDKVLKINGNLVTVNLQGGKGYTYSFFNSVNISNYYLDKSDDSYVFFIGGYNE